MDFIVKLPLSNGYNSILTVTDHDCTKAVILIPCNEAITAEGVAKLYLEHVFKCVGLPKIFIHDPRHPVHEQLCGQNVPSTQYQAECLYHVSS